VTTFSKSPRRYDSQKRSVSYSEMRRWHLCTVHSVVCSEYSSAIKFGGSHSEVMVKFKSST
jgi:hypothetical protein